MSRICSPDKSTWEYFNYKDIIPRAQNEGAKALDIGCGSYSGTFLKNIGYTVTGYDIIRGDSTAIIGDGCLLPFKDDCFELATSMSVFEHLQDPWQGCSEIYRVLKPGGILACSLSFLEPYHAHSYYHFSHLGAHNLLEKSGFTVLKIAPLGFSCSEACLRHLIPIPGLARLFGLIVRGILRLRRVGIKTISLYYRRRDKSKYQRALEYLYEDTYRFEAGFKLLGQKKT